MKHDNGSESVMSQGPWAQLVAVRKAVCSDGKSRYAKITGQPDTFFSVPASVQVRYKPEGSKYTVRKTVTGFITMASTYKDGVKEGYEFVANRFGKNGHLLRKEL
jgi:hypothetical protein